MEPSDIFRNNVFSLIEQRKLVQANIATEINETPQSLNDYLKGRINWSEKKRKKLATYIKIDYHELYNRKFDAGSSSDIGLKVEVGAEIIRKPTAQVDPTLLKKVIDGVEEHLTSINRSLSTDLKSKLIALLYDRYAGTDEKMDQKKIAHYLKLVA